MMKIAIAITGASGSIYAHHLIDRLLATSQVETLGLIFTTSGRNVADYELHGGVEQVESLASDPRVVIWQNDDFYTPIASGSASWDALVVVPCSMGTLGRVAAGVSSDLVSRAADVMLKERRCAIFCTREAPLSLIHLRNMTTITEAGGCILPLSPSFYTLPVTIDELCNSVISRIISQLGLPIAKGWQE